ncbi:MAG: glycosyltransferase family 2 protein [Clostridia bacterium]|nr:glycosyltransferase family 2 protein [Clostridia bacterium]MBR3754109.1 glycosyltransferase family 2 protein [Clostridia bacterium]
MDKKKISVMIPCYNEEENARPIYEAVKSELEKSLPQYDYEILFIDNKSTDNTRKIIREICKENKKVRAIFNCRNFGQFNSPYYGIINTSGDCCITICADFQDPVELIPQFVKEWENGYKVVIGVKTQSKESKVMYALRSLYYKAIKKMSNVEQIEHFTGFGLYDKSFVKTLRELDDPQPFIRGIVAELGPERKEIEYTQPQRRAGKTHNNFYSLYDAAMLSFTSYTKIGLRLAVFAGGAFSLIGFIIALVYLILKLVNWYRFPAGTTPILIGVFLMGSIQMFFIGLLGEYIMNINSRVMKRPLVVEEERLNFEEEEENGNP